MSDAMIERRCWRRVRFTPSGCWEWQGYLSRGYGRFGTPPNHAQAHRWAYERAFGPVPKNLVVMHTCDNRRCVRLAHLKVGTRRDNTQDMMSKGRHRGNAEGSKTHCKRGHAFTRDNTYTPPRGGRQCRTCDRAYRKLKYWQGKIQTTTGE